MTNQSVLTQLMGVINDRRDNPPAKSYTTSLFSGGVSKIGEKITEEAAELIEAAEAFQAAKTETAAETASHADARKHLNHEAADLLYHVLVMLSHCGLELSDVEAELASRFGVSGIDEKASRQDK